MDASPPSRADASPVHEFLAALHRRVAHEESGGEVAAYIPELARADPADFGIAITTAEGEIHVVGDTEVPFTIQSISKALLYGMALEDNGPEAVLAKVGVEPTGEAFNSIRLQDGSGNPFNPMVNAGAIATTGLLTGGDTAAKLERILDTFGRYAGRALAVDEAVYRSERDTGHRNRAIAHLLRNFSVIGDDPEGVLDLYFHQCSVLVTCRDLAMMGATLANKGVNPVTGVRAVEERHVASVLSVMATCGMYDFAGEWLFDVGLPAKSGVAGGILAVLPGQLGIGIFSPPLDARGNSVRGIRVCHELSSGFAPAPVRSAPAGRQRRAQQLVVPDAAVAAPPRAGGPRGARRPRRPHPRRHAPGRPHLHHGRHRGDGRPRPRAGRRLRHRGRVTGAAHQPPRRRAARRPARAARAPAAPCCWCRGRPTTRTCSPRWTRCRRARSRWSGTISTSPWSGARTSSSRGSASRPATRARWPWRTRSSAPG